MSLFSPLRLYRRLVSPIGLWYLQRALEQGLPASFIEPLRFLFTEQLTQADRKVVRLYMSQAAAAVPAVVTHLQQASLEPVSLTLTQPTLDDVFLQVTGERFEADAAENTAVNA